MINTKLKRGMAVSLVAAMAVSSLAACSSSSSSSTESSSSSSSTESSSDSTAESSSENTGESSSETTEVSKMEAPDSSDWDDSKKIYVYLWDADGEGKAEIVKEAMGDLGDYVEIVNINAGGQSEDYQNAVNNALDGGDKYPSVILADEGIAKIWSESDDTLDLSSIGITSDMYANAYSYTIDYGTYNGTLKALSWQATPGCLCYRADIAEEVLGTSDPDEVGEMLSDWDKFMEVAAKMKDAGYKMTSGTNEIKYSVLNQRTEPWVTVADDGSETLNLDDTLFTKYIDLAKELYDGGYTNDANTWTDNWGGSMAEGDVFCYFGCTWFIGSMEGYCAADSANYGQWRTTTTPESYYWGGTYMMVGKDTPNQELAAYFVYMMCCDEDVLYSLAADKGDFVNSSAVVEKLIADGVGARDILGGQNPLETFAEAAKSINSQASYIDGTVLEKVDNGITSYNKGELSSADDVIAYIKSELATKYDYIAQ